MESQPTPPDYRPEADGGADVELLRAISAHPEAAHALAAIAGGADPASALADLLPQPKGIPVSSPSFLASIQPDFWENF